MTLRPERANAYRAVAACGLVLLLFAALAAASVLQSSWDGTFRSILLRHMPEIPGDDKLIFLTVASVGAILTVFSIGFFAVRKRTNAALFWVLAVSGMLALDPLLKGAFERPEANPHSSSFSFPSGNAMLSMAVVMAGVLTAPRRWRPPLLAAGVPFLIAYGGLTVESQSHYPSDVVAGWCFAFAWTVGLSFLVLRRGGRASRSAL